MKQIMLLTFLLGNILHVANAQDGKPTKEETVEYLQSNYPSQVYYSAHGMVGNAKLFYTGNISKALLSIRDSILTVTYCDTVLETVMEGGEINKTIYRSDIYELRFNLKEIESIGVSWMDELGYVEYKTAISGTMLYKLVFFAANKKQVIKVTKNGITTMEAYAELPITSSDIKNKDNTNYQEWKIYKAFDHLRKRCGAKDPISFD